MGFINYVQANGAEIFSLTLEHIRLTTIAVLIAIAIGVPLGIMIHYFKKAGKPVLGTANIVQAIPSIALLGFMIPLFGIGTVPAVIAVILYSLLPIIKNTYTGLENINPETLEAAKGIGLTRSQILFKVQVPMALPVIMAGVRISSVTAVGLMTMGAFIGAGGLGTLVFSGIRTVNNYQILSGAIPACILALGIDYVMNLVEHLVGPTPMSRNKKGKLVQAESNLPKKLLLVVAALLVVFSFVEPLMGQHIAKSDKTIAIGGKDHTEAGVLANLAADMIEGNSDIQVERKFDLGGTQVVLGAVEADEVDMYIDYTGTVYCDILKHEPESDMDAVYDACKTEMKDQYDLDVLNQFGFNNTYIMAVSQETAEKYNLKTDSDLAKVADQLTLGCTLEFLNRDDGMKGLQKTYNFEFGNAIGLDGATRYVALNSGEVDVCDAFSTDGLLKKFDLVTLEDDQHFFPPYYAVPVIRNDTLQEYPEIEEMMDELGPYLTEEAMAEMNYEVDELGMTQAEAAHKFLEENGLI